MEVVNDYLGLGVPTVWIFDPLKKKAYVTDQVQGPHEVSDKVTAYENRVVLTLAEIFPDSHHS